MSRKLPSLVEPLDVTCYCSSMLGVMKSPREVPGRSKETSVPWNGWSGNVEHRSFFSLSLQQQTDPVYQYLVGVTARIWVFLVMKWSAQHQTCLCQMGFVFLTQARGSLLMSYQGILTGFKTDLKGERCNISHDKPLKIPPNLLYDSPTLPRTKNVAANLPVIQLL